MSESPATLPGHKPNPELLSAALQLLSEVGTVVASTTELRPVLEVLVRRSSELLGADEGSIKVLGPEPSAAEATARTMVRSMDRHGVGSWPRPISDSVMGWLLARHRPLVTPDLTSDADFSGLRGMQTHVRAVLAVPLVVDNRITGFLAVTRREPGRQWSADEIQLLGIVAGNSAVMIEQARLRAEAEEKKQIEAERDRMERDLRLARDIQMGLVPSEPMSAGPWDVHGRLEPARQVGGDYYDYFPIGGDRIAVAIADVSGKGVPASLLMSNCEATLRAFCDGARPIPEAIRSVNRRMSLTSSGGKFVTLFYAEIDPSAGRMRFCNAGHNYPLLRRADGTLEELRTGGLLIGLFPEAEYEMGDVAFGHDDAVLLYSDGLSEAMNLRNEEYGEERLFALWKSLVGVSAADAMARVFDDIGRHRGSAAQSDDMTAVILAPRRA